MHVGWRRVRNRVSRYLGQPYPMEVLPCGIILAIGAFVGAFLAYFKPFGLSHAEGSWFAGLVIPGYGAVTILVLWIVARVLPRSLPRTFNEKTWSLLKEYLYILLILFTIGIGNYLYTEFFFDLRSGVWEGIWMFQFYTVVVGAFPVAMMLVISHNRLLRKHLESARDFGQLPAAPRASGQKIAIRPESGRDALWVDPMRIYYAEAYGNYVKIVHEGPGGIDTALLRMTMNSLAAQLGKAKDIVRCHRAYFVNVRAVQEVRGNAQGYRLRLQGLPDEVIVSRSRVGEFRHQLRRREPVANA